MILSEVYKLFLDTVRDAQNNAKYEESEVVRCDEATQDLLHQLELGSYRERQKTTTQLVHLRKQRRKSKDVLLVTEPLIKLLEQPESIKFIRQLQQVLGETRKVENKLKNRSYTPRVITTIEIASNTSEE